MRAVIQRVLKSKVVINNTSERSISEGFLVLLGIEDADTIDDVEWLSGKIARLRIFDDENGVMNKNIIEIGGNVMLVSQFTLHASTKKGNRPSYIKASKPDFAIPIYQSFIKQLCIDLQKEIVTGEFGADMKIELINNGPVTIIIDTQNKE